MNTLLLVFVRPKFVLTCILLCKRWLWSSNIWVPKVILHVWLWLFFVCICMNELMWMFIYVCLWVWSILLCVYILICVYISIYMCVWCLGAGRQWESVLGDADRHTSGWGGGGCSSTTWQNTRTFLSVSTGYMLILYSCSAVHPALMV